MSITNLLRYTDGEVRFDGIFPDAAPVAGADFAAARGVAANYSVISTGASYAANQLVQNHGRMVVNKEVRRDPRRSAPERSSKPAPYRQRISPLLDEGCVESQQPVAHGCERQAAALVAAGRDETRTASPNTPRSRLLTDYDATAYSLYAADEWQVTDALRFDFGVRYGAQDIEGTIRAAGWRRRRVCPPISMATRRQLTTAASR